MRHFLTAGLTLAAASTVAAAPAAASAPPANGDPATLNYAVANFYAYWSLGHVLEAAFEIKEKDTDKFVAYCTGKVPSSISPPPDNQPSSLGNCVSLDRESTISATVGGDPGTNLLIYVKDELWSSNAVRGHDQRQCRILLLSKLGTEWKLRTMQSEKGRCCRSYHEQVRCWQGRTAATSTRPGHKVLIGIPLVLLHVSGSS
ncbi:hypothetical protein JOL62DRAFT_40936 [Phyllosticta paracitricarpa]|uniref:Uncharacterized protein n=1 Tax=Phyllosticta paracitricarpa TaxID=2016321 RepID=A0ABR1NAL0_9PEZI